MTAPKRHARHTASHARALSVPAHILQSPVYRRRWAVLIAAIVVVAIIIGSVVAHITNAGVSGDPPAASVQSAAKQAQPQTSSQPTTKDVRKASVPAISLTHTELALQGISGLDGGAEISASGFTLDTASQTQLEQELQVFADNGYQASFVLVDMSTGKALSSLSDTARYSASSIKGPYILSLAATNTINLDSVYQGATNADSYTQQRINSTITVSNNDTYLSLFSSFGSDPFATWKNQAGASVDVTDPYVYISASDLARMWAQGYGYLFDGDTNGVASLASDGDATVASAESRQWLASEFSDTLNSSIHMALGDQYSVYSKAGWINGDGGYYALNDAGVVSSSSGDYVLALLTDACGEYDMLVGLISVLDSIHASLMGA